MPQLEQIAATFVAGFLVHSISILLFGVALKLRSTHIAPRCEARPRNVIYNPNPEHSSQDRGNPFLGWVPWVLKLSYEEMMRGIPGTGTRQGGMAGSLLRVNLDDVVMLRFHSYGLRVTTLGLFIYTLILLPLYWTAGCSDAPSSDEAIKNHCTNLTNYDWTTLANIEPEIELGKISVVGLSIRLYIVVFCSWFVNWYACYELKQEWKDILAMRRFYYLERDHWRERQAEDQEASPRSSQFNARKSQSMAYRRRVSSMWTASAKNDKTNNNYKEPDYVNERDPWIPHPEYRDTPPSVALWSVLVGKIPSKPKTHRCEENDDDEEDPESPNSAHSNREWQLSVTSAFFDHCIPNQPGFSSSVAAVTILPNAAELAAAWRKWYAAASKLRRLRFIRKQIRLKRHYDIEVDEENAEGQPPSEASLGELSSRPSRRSRAKARFTISAVEDVHNRRILGSAMDDDVEELYLEALDFGPEQTAVYIREFAQSAAPCCPNGCFEGAVTGARIDELVELEQIAMEEVQAANDALEMARLNAVMDASLKEANEGGRVRLRDEVIDEDEEFDLSRMRNNSPMQKRPSAIKNMGLAEIPLDLSAVRKLVKSDTIQNLMGKDASVPTEKGKGAKADMMSSASDKLFLEDTILQRLTSKEKGKVTEEEELHASTTRRGGILTRSQSSPVMHKLAGLPGASRQVLSDRKSECGFLPSIVDEDYQDSDPDEMEEHAPLSGSLASHADEEDEVEGKQESAEAHVPPSIEPPEATEEEDLPEATFTSEQSVENTLKIDPLSSPEGDSMPARPRLRTSSRSCRQSQTPYDPLDAWALVDALAMNSQEYDEKGDEHLGKERRVLSEGNWELSSVAEFVMMFVKGIRHFLRWTTTKSNEAVNEAVDIVAADSTYAVVTFTSRQAAVAARKVLADGRGSNRWMQLDTLPIPPLADAAACDPITCRGCCRPVTLSINDRQKTYRWYLSLGALFGIYFFYTLPLTAVSALANDEHLTALFPGLSESSFLNSALLSSLFAALIWAAFFAVCPVIFKTIANVGSNANSTVEAEFSALKYFWWFMVVSAFSGTSLQRMILEGFNDGISIGKEFQEVMRTIASTIPTQVSASWINWIIVKTSVTAPLSYMLQVNTYLLNWSQLKCCARAVKGGGPGGPLPFRVYVDSGVVLLCLFALAPAAPLVAPFAFLYFLLSTPMLRRNVIFMYRPRFDAGGVRFPFLFEMCISGMFVGQILLATMMGLKKSLGPCVCAAIAFVPTLLFRDNMRARYLRAFNDVGLLQTSLLDGWDTASPESFGVREERRKWIVDCHRAAYVPVCMASTQTDEVLTAEPAVVVPTMEEADPNHNNSFSSLPSELTSMKDMSMADYSMMESRRMSASQYGASLRRASAIISPTVLETFVDWSDEMGGKRKQESEEFGNRHSASEEFGKRKST
ncbi:DUF221 domain-containing protein [Seminavis robusta]|uniref:DUF221 domain-containing protein n=1 Tax=Seminavis robusta TaxID=568900 RepID=A0A9N8DCN6_9STRA|nr:DUF221 domain-containing protein [Seminavis robusta]|eukprot:Sro83_g044150.1 DUF221 domain-containing protein (1427) ;mRNA; r:2086-6794